MIVREPFGAGRFYPDNKTEIVDMIDRARKKGDNSLQIIPGKLIGGISPHAGYMFSLSHMIPLFELFKTNITSDHSIILLNPNHSGYGAALSIDSHSHWRTPLGNLRVDEILSDILIEKSSQPLNIKREPLAQKREHSAEVILPLIQYYLGDVSFLPLSLGYITFEIARNLAELFFQIMNETDTIPMIIASSDFNHFDSPQRGKELDNLALEPLLKLDSKEMIKRIHENNISICGYGPIAVLLEFAKLVSSHPQVSILSRGHSGESEYYNGREQQEVVDYISLAVYEK
jgi:AmmeMemoRadiSam system protein B